MAEIQGLATSKDLVVLNFAAKNKEQVIRELGQRVLKKGHIEEEFIERVLKREEEFPTGLAFEVNIAIPHIGEHCNNSFLSFATLKEPVLFSPMDGSEEDLNVEIVFLFGITNPEAQVEVLKKFIFAFREGDALVKLKGYTEAAEALNYLNTILGNVLEIMD